MAEMHQEPSGGADFDLTQFYQIFFEEAGENLDQMEQMLLDLDPAATEDEELNGIFRCAHSIKGGAATFGFSDVAECPLPQLLRQHLLRRRLPHRCRHPRPSWPPRRLRKAPMAAVRSRFALARWTSPSRPMRCRSCSATSPAWAP